MDEKDIIQAVLLQCYHFLSFRARTEHEMREYTKRKLIRFEKKLTKSIPETADLVIQKLQDQLLIDDKKFIELWVAGRNALKPKGAYALKNELLQKGIPKNLIEEYFENLPADNEIMANKALLPKWRIIKLLPKERRFQKAASFLLRRGFEYEIVKKVIQRFEEEER